jgi:S1-C subfamily serine protease
MRYYRQDWVPVALGPSGGSGNGLLAAILTAAFFALGAVGVWALAPRGTAQLVPATVYIEAEFQGAGVKSSGSGVIIHSDGNVITNKHVVFMGGKEADKITVHLYSGDHDRHVVFEDAEVKDKDPTNVEWAGAQVGPGGQPQPDPNKMWHDWAVLKINSDSRLPFLPIGNSRQLKTGDNVRAVGFPGGQGFSPGPNGPTPRVDPGQITRLQPGDQGNVVRLDHNCQIFQGNSGGPLVNQRGELVGINTGGVPGGTGEHWAIPSHMLREVWQTYAEIKPVGP